MYLSVVVTNARNRRVIQHLSSRLKAFLLKIPTWLFMEFGKLILIFVWKCKLPRKANAV